VRRVAPPWPSAGEPLAVADGAGVVRGGREVLRDVSLTLAAGEVLAVVGPNGAGKSSLLSALAGDLSVASGTVSVGGRLVGRARAGAGVLAVLHDLNLAAAHADRVAVVGNDGTGGRLRACGPPAEVLTSALLTEVYQREVEVLAHPRAGTPLVLPVRGSWDDRSYP